MPHLSAHGLSFPTCCVAELQEFCEEHGYNCRLEAAGTLFIPPDYNVSVTDWERSLRLRWAPPAAAVASAELCSVCVASAALLQGFCRKHLLAGECPHAVTTHSCCTLCSGMHLPQHLRRQDRLQQQAVPP